MPIQIYMGWYKSYNGVAPFVTDRRALHDHIKVDQYRNLKRQLKLLSIVGFIFNLAALWGFPVKMGVPL